MGAFQYQLRLELFNLNSDTVSVLGKLNGLHQRVGQASGLLVFPRVVHGGDSSKTIRLSATFDLKLAPDVAINPDGTHTDYGFVNGPEFTSKALGQWAYDNKVTLDFSRPGKPTDNAFIESFNGSFRTECLNENWFLSFEDAREKIEAWRVDYNEHPPHSALGNLAPRDFASSGQASLAS
ncbi:Integrase core domain protein [Crateriforma conspicua]|uniref:Integrase core domain protein n=1 Tax=Crateriforma conspicua TaxID=2527996 RepID=A0A5C5YB53_9PLAN|nr:Integrase core domain protein [Crateriforma conspicua]